MAIDRDARRSRSGSTRDSGRFILIPCSVFECPAYMRLSANARCLLLEVALQYHGSDNGRLLLSRAHLSKRGWTSSDMITKGKRELLAAGFIFETVMGHRPNKASWYAVTWCSLDKLNGFDPGAASTFERSAYRKNTQAILPTKNASLRPPHGALSAVIAPRDGTSGSASVPRGGAVYPLEGIHSVPPRGHPIEGPSASAVPAFNINAAAAPVQSGKPRRRVQLVDQVLVNQTQEAQPVAPKPRSRQRVEVK